MNLHQSVGFASATLVAPSLAGPALAAGPLDPDCIVTKAARGATTKAVVGVRGNRCGAGETMRDTLGVDDRVNSNRCDRMEISSWSLSVE